MKRKVIILGAAGRDFHNFNCFFRDNPEYEVAAFTATQIPNIDGRVYPPELAGSLYPNGIPIDDEANMARLIRVHNVDLVVFAYSDVSYEYLMHRAATVNACGADFMLMGTRHTQVVSSKPVIAVCATRTGCGKSQTTRAITDILRGRNLKVVAIRHPMPYGDLARQAVQRFDSLADLKKHDCTIEEMEEYEPHIVNGVVVFAGVDYEAILREAEKEADVILWDGGNNDMSFYRADLCITVADPHRAGHELLYYPGETNVRLADVVVISKMDTAAPEGMDLVISNVRTLNPGARIIKAASPVTLEDPGMIKGKRVLVVEDGPTLTHGEMKIGAGTVAARNGGAAECVDPRPYTVGTITATYDKYPEIGALLPAMGYGAIQVRDLEETISRTPCEAVIIGTPIDLRRIINIRQPSTRARYDLARQAIEELNDVVGGLLDRTR